MIDNTHITIYQQPRNKWVHTRHPFFAEEFVVLLGVDKIVFRRAGLDDTRVQKSSLTNGRYCFTVPSSVPAGRFEIDPEESDEDKIVIHTFAP